MCKEMKKVFLMSFILLSILTACNKDWEFPDYKFSAVYFPYQSPVRTIVLGEDIFDNTLDNQHKFMIMATMGGVYENKNDISIGVSVDNSLAQKLKFGTATGDSVFALPTNYYTFPKEMKIIIPSGKLQGGLEVQLTDAFFADPLAIKNTYVIPLKINSVTGADSVLSGKVALGVTSPDPRRASDWIAVPKDYTLYAVKYINPYHGVYLRRGITEVKGNGGNTALDTTLDLRQPPPKPSGELPPRNTFVEKDMLSYIYTKSLTQDTVSLTTKNKGSSTDVPFQLVLTFNANGDIAVSAPASATYTASGNGKLVKKGDMWGNEKRDVMHLKYQVNFATTTHNFSDTLVARDRGVKFETFTPVLVP
jgi:hypothetical protein